MKIKLMCALCALLLLSSFRSDERDTITVFMIGDSTMANKPLGGDNPERGWGQMLAGYFTEDVRVDNHALNGRSSKSFIDEGHAFFCSSVGWICFLTLKSSSKYSFIVFGIFSELKS